MKILLVEDDASIADICKRALVEAGYVVDRVGDGQSALDSFELNIYDLLILDILLPTADIQGLDVCRHVRQVNTAIPILLLTALDSPKDKVRGLDAGADDYLVKPFHISELLARTRALMRRSPRSDATILKAQTVALDPATRQAKRHGKTIFLTAKEYSVLEYLLRNAGRVVSQTELLEHAWDSNYSGMSNVVETYIRYLRKKLNAHGEPDIIETLRGSGYIIQADKQ
jgi:DNA-binding response OmpR family regulator